ncbi:MAG: hypothetical protein EP338_11850 [Bacteroidetes bacterium]|nr:MAG: hypothetical protein EP338_11850 [Bacteroidota bacterium]
MGRHATDLNKLFLGLFCLILFPFLSIGQGKIPPLERPMSLELKGESTKEVLSKMEKLGGYTFAYRTDLVPENDRLVRFYKDRTTREILDDLFQGKLTYKERGNYIVLKPGAKVEDAGLSISGYIVDAQSGRKVTYASVFDSLSLISAVSDEYGYYQLDFKKRKELVLTVRKEGYRDTSFNYRGSGHQLLTIELEPLLQEDSALSKRLSGNLKKWMNRLREFELSEEQKANISNFKERILRRSQVSLLPYIGTNGKLSGITEVDYSFNVLGGFNGAVRRMEIGGLFNMVWDSVSYLQIAGIFNLVGGKQQGLQIAGVTNLNDADFMGTQISGVHNRVRGNLRGTQISGVYNSVGTSLSGMQIAGLWNRCGNGSRGTQISGFGNVAGDQFQGLQLAPIMNVAQRMNGAQLALFNFSDSISGTPFGLFSYSRKGLHQLELGVNEAWPYQVAFRTGVNSFYNIFSYALRFSGKELTHWGLGYGLGSSVRLGRKTKIYLDLQSQLLRAYQLGGKTQFLHSVNMGLNWQLKRKLAFFIGPSVRLLQSPMNAGNQFERLYDLGPYSSIFEQSKNYNFKAWLGIQMGFRLF